MTSSPLDLAGLAAAAERLAEVDPYLRVMLHRQGPPPLWKRPATFGTLIHIVLEQQVSLDSARATYECLRRACGGRVTAPQVRARGEAGLRELGFTRQKARYGVALADDVVSGRFRVGALRYLDDDAVRSQIKARLGLGDWTASVFLLMALARPDVLPLGDLALVKGLQELDGGDYASSKAVLARAEVWRPFRSVATRMIWQLYLANRNRLASFHG